MFNILFALLFYIIGTIPSAYLCGRLFGRVDIREIGSGNVGAMNAFKNIGYLPGILSLLLDIAKGALAVYLAMRFGTFIFLPLLASFLVILGHNYNVFLGFRGGKGIGSLIGVLLVLSPAAFSYQLIIIVAFALLLKDSNTAAGLGIVFLPAILGILEGHWAFILAGTGIAILMILKHLPDFRAYQAGKRKLL